jgi:outer membrane immunogenic protein
MKSLTRFVIASCACSALALTAVAGPEALPRDSSKDKEVMAAPAPPGCEWSGFYVGINAGGQFGHSENTDLGNGTFGYNALDQPWGYSESGFVGGAQIGYNFQFHWLVLGAEGDLGYMNLDGRGVEPAAALFSGSDTRGETSSDFYTTFRGRIGVALNCWLIYATGGGIAVNYHTGVVDDCSTGNCGAGLINASTTDFDWGYTFGGGIERMIGRHWTFRVEYLYFALDTQSFSGQNNFQNGPFRFDGETAGHIVRVGLNYKF